MPPDRIVFSVSHDELARGTRLCRATQNSPERDRNPARAFLRQRLAMSVSAGIALAIAKRAQHYLRDSESRGRKFPWHHEQGVALRLKRRSTRGPERTCSYRRNVDKACGFWRRRAAEVFKMQ